MGMSSDFEQAVNLCKFACRTLQISQRRLSFTVGDSVSAFWVKLGANDLNCVDVPLNHTHSLTQATGMASDL